MLKRALFDVAFSDNWGRQMRFITGPRQCGKTTLAKAQLKETECAALYYAWDERRVRERYKVDELFFQSDRAPRATPAWVCFDEIHKMPRWKNILKGIFDATEDRYRFVITGSAKFDMFRRAGDSLSGRFFSFHLFPLLLAETLHRAAVAPPPPEALDWVRQRLDSPPAPQQHLRDLLAFSGFPEPCLQQSTPFLAKWSREYLDSIVRDDIGALTRIIDKEHLVDLYHLLPEMVGSPLSEHSLASHLQLNPLTIKNHLKRLRDFYLTFRLPPYSKNIKRSLLKASKTYLFDWTRVPSAGPRFENFLAVELLSRLSLWTDATGEPYDLTYLRTREKEETDFLILRERRPWLMVEAKISDSPVESHHRRLQKEVGSIPLVQVCQEEGVARVEAHHIFRLSAQRFLATV